MNEILMIFLSLSLSGSLVTMILFLLKPLYKDRLSKTWQYYVLLIVILRLLVPFGPEISLVGMIFNQAQSYAYIGNVPAVNVPEAGYALQQLPVETPSIPDDTANIGNLKSIGQMAINLLWFAPAFLLMLRKVIIYYRYVRSIKIGYIRIVDGHVMDLYREVCEAMKIRRFPHLAQNSVAAPMLVGTIRPVIVLPDICLDDKEMRYVLQHELVHYKRLDIIYKWLAQITLCLHWFNPLVYWICREINRNCELSCDEVIIRQLDETEKYAYGNMLLDTIKRKNESPLPVVSLKLNEDTKLIKERLNAIKKFKKASKTYVAVSMVLAVFLLSGAVYIGVYSQSNDIFTTLFSDVDETYMHAIPDTIEFSQVLVSSSLQFGFYELDTNSNYSLTLSWQDGGDTLKILLIGEDGCQKEYTLTNGAPININVPQNGLYTFMSPRNRETGDMSSLSVKFYVLDTLTPATLAKVSENAQTVVYESVEMHHYEDVKGSSIPAHPYIYDIKANYTNKKITEYQRGMLAYDKDGKPLKIDWYPLDSERDSTFYFLYDWGSTEILPGKSDDTFGGWSLNIDGNDPVVNEIAFILYCDKEIAFEDGTVWKNPDFDDWRKSYEGKTIDVNILENYYPYVQKIVY